VIGNGEMIEAEAEDLDFHTTSFGLLQVRIGRQGPGMLKVETEYMHIATSYTNNPPICTYSLLNDRCPAYKF
jgi:hypothetical protein